MTKVSIIIPVYNVEAYIKRCLDSVINQTLNDIEIICINDGSTDNSAKIIEKYAKLDNRILLINQANQGVSIARNMGIKQSTGEYLIFVDPNDWIETNLAEVAYKKIHEDNLDVVSFGYKCHTEDIYYVAHTIDILDKNKNIIPLGDIKNLVHCAWDKIYKREFIINNKIVFPLNVKNAEDGCFSLQCLLHNAKWGGLNKSLYNYREIRKNSAMSNILDLVKNEMDALYTFVKFDIFEHSCEELKIVCLDKFMGDFIYRYNQPCSLKIKLNYLKQIQKFSNDIKKIIPESLLLKTSHYKKIKKVSLLRILAKQLFCVKNERFGNFKWKVLVILGIKIKFNKTLINQLDIK